ncbi:MAG: hypothetical protein COA52_11490, partial [Hyphomicrobiales bacterium]
MRGRFHRPTSIISAENDCANLAGTHSCQGQSTVSYDAGEW